MNVTTEKSPKVSIIIPAYNAEKYLAETMVSVFRQTLKNIEIVIIDDCSKDNTPALLKTFSKQDDRIKILRNDENEGILTSRYRAFLVSSGEYVMFLDADDYLEPDACEVLAREMDEGQWDFVGFNTELFDTEDVPEDTITFLKRYLKFSNWSLRGKQGSAIAPFVDGKIAWNVWNKIYRRELIEKAFSQYSEGHIQMAEDLCLTCMCVSYAKSFAFLDRTLHHYRLGSGMSTRTDMLSENKLERFANIGKVYTLLKKWIPNTGLKSNDCTALLDFAHDHTIPDELYALVHRVPESLQSKYLDVVLSYMSLQDFTEEFVTWTFQKWSVSHVEAAQLFANSLPPMPKREIKTVAMYYNRLYNGGVERVISLLTPILQNIGYRVVIITEEGPTIDDYPLPEGTVHIRLMSPVSAPMNRLKEWVKIIKNYSIDAVIYHAWISTNMWLDAIAIKSRQIPLILHSHNSFQFPFLDAHYAGINWLEQKKIYAAFDAIVALSEVDTAWCRALQLNAVHVNNPLTYQPEDCVPSSLTSPEAVWVARLSYEKQYEDAFEIARLVHEKLPSFKLRIVGKAETEEEFRAISNRLDQKGMSEYVILEGFHQDVRPFYQSASALLMTSKYEGYPMVLTEAKCFGLPIVIYEMPNLSVIRQPDSGVSVVPQGDKIAAADRLIELMSNPELRRKEGLRSRESIDVMYQNNLETTWKNILEVTIWQKQKPIPLHQADPISAAVQMAMDNLTQWLNPGNNQAVAPSFVPVVPQDNSILESYRNEVNAYRKKSVKRLRRRRRIEMRFAGIFSFLRKIKNRLSKNR